MQRSKKIQWKPLICSLIISLGVGGLAAFFTRNSMEVYMELNRPPLSPPPVVFPIVWTVLYILMGISAYRIYLSDMPQKKPALWLYFIQLIFNFLWPILFFNLQSYLAALICLLILWLLILAMIMRFCRIDRTAALLQIPYLLWVTFAGYLNWGIWLLNL